MPDIYDLTNVTSANNIFEIVKEVNILSGNLFAILMLTAVFLIIFIVFKVYDTKKTFVAASAVTSFIGILLWTIGFIPFYIIYFPVVALAISLFIFIWAK